MPFDDLEKSVDNLRDGILQAVFDAADVAAAGFVAEFVRRVQFKGENSKGSKLGTYAKSTSTYKKRRGQPSQFVNLTDTFRMLGSVDLQSKTIEENGVRMIIAPGNQSRGKIDNKELMAIQEERYGVIMGLQPDEEEEMTLIFEESLQVLLNRLGF